MLLAVGIPQWEPQPDVWLLVGLLVAGYAIAIARVGPRWAGPDGRCVTRSQITCWGLGVLATWIAADWPVHEIAERMNYSVHMVQHLTFSMVATPLLILGMPAWMMRGLLARLRLLPLVRKLAHFIPALIVYNLVLVFTHWPAVVNASLTNGVLHFGLHSLLFLSSLVGWLPVLSPLPEVPRFPPLLRMAYLFAWSVVPTVPASFLTFGSKPLYSSYVGLPHLWGLSTLHDQQLAGLIMKLGAGLLLWMLIAVVFFRWAGAEDRASTPRHSLDEMDRELTQMGLRR